MRISDGSSDVCSSDLGNAVHHRGAERRHAVHLRRRDLLRLPRHGPALTRAQPQSMQFEQFLGNPLLALGLTLPRISGAFIMLPLLTQQNMPSMVCNSFLVSLAVVALPVALAGLPDTGMSMADLAPIALKELFIGIPLAP